MNDNRCAGSAQTSVVHLILQAVVFDQSFKCASRGKAAGIVAPVVAHVDAVLPALAVLAIAAAVGELAPADDDVDGAVSDAIVVR